jgi:hypothetical protein
MDYQSRQEKIQEAFFKDKCGGQFNSANYSYVLKDEYRKDNLYPPIAENAIEYFKENRIVWWRGKDWLPTNHTLSSQISCINHLFWIRNNVDAATDVLKQLDKDFVAIPFPETKTYVEFELNGCDKDHRHSCLGEKGSARGANTTSIDAAMLAKKEDKIILIFLEWKYVEHYSRTIKAIKTETQYEIRKNTYKKYLLEDDCPIILDKTEIDINTPDLDFDKEYVKFSIEPFYQLMRQTLLAWKLSSGKRYGADDFLHVDIIPFANTKLLKCNTSPAIVNGYADICSAWRCQLKSPEKYIHIDPSQLIGNSAQEYNPSLSDYLNRRYWRGGEE